MAREDDVWARAAADRSGSYLLAAGAPFALTVLVKLTVLDELVAPLDGLGATTRALLGVLAGALLVLPLLLWALAHRGSDRTRLPLTGQAWALLCVLACTVLWVPGRGRDERAERVLEQAGPLVVTLALTTAVLLVSALVVTVRPQRT